MSLEQALQDLKKLITTEPTPPNSGSWVWSAEPDLEWLKFNREKDRYNTDDLYPTLENLGIFRASTVDVEAVKANHKAFAEKIKFMLIINETLDSRFGHEFHPVTLGLQRVLLELPSPSPVISKSNFQTLAPIIDSFLKDALGTFPKTVEELINGWHSWWYNESYYLKAQAAIADSTFYKVSASQDLSLDKTIQILQISIIEAKIAQYISSCEYDKKLTTPNKILNLLEKLLDWLLFLRTNKTNQEPVHIERSDAINLTKKLLVELNERFRYIQYVQRHNIGLYTQFPLSLPVVEKQKDLVSEFMDAINALDPTTHSYIQRVQSVFQEFSEKHDKIYEGQEGNHHTHITNIRLVGTHIIERTKELMEEVSCRAGVSLTEGHVERISFNQ